MKTGAQNKLLEQVGTRYQVMYKYVKDENCWINHLTKTKIFSQKRLKSNSKEKEESKKGTTAKEGVDSDVPSLNCIRAKPSNYSNFLSSLANESF